MSSPSWAVEALVQRADVDCDINIGGTGMAVIWVMTILAMTVVGMRLYSQARITKLLGLSDWLMLASILTIIAFASLISVQYHYGWGRHQACITDVVRLETQIKYNFAGQSFGIMGSTFGRLSFIVFMDSLFGSRYWVRFTLWAMFGAQLVTNLVTVAMIYAQCKDPRALYIFTMSQAQCWPAYVQTYLGWAHTSFNGACDLFLSVLPTVMVWNLHMHTRLKVGVAILLGMSALALVGLVMKCVYLDALSYEGDYSYNTVPMFTWIMVEGCLVAIAASIPVLRPMFRHTFPSRAGATTGAPSYDLPRYAVHSGQTDSSGFTRLGSKALTSVRIGTTSSSRLSSVPRYPGMTMLDPGSSEEDMVLCLQQNQQQQQLSQKEQHGECNQQRRQSEVGLPSGGIVVKQEYTVTSEVMEKGWEDREPNAEIGLTIQTKELGGLRTSLSKSSAASEAADMPQSPASAYRRGNP